MAKQNGDLWAILSGSDKLLHLKNASLDIDRDLIDSTNKDSGGWKEHEKGSKSWQIPGEGDYDTAGSGMTPNEIITAIIGDSADTVIKWTPDAGTTGWTGNATFKNLSMKAAHGDIVRFSFTLVGNGALAAI